MSQWWKKTSIQIISAPYVMGTPELENIKDNFKIKLDIEKIDEIEKTPGATFLLLYIKTNRW